MGPDILLGMWLFLMLACGVNKEAGSADSSLTAHVDSGQHDTASGTVALIGAEATWVSDHIGYGTGGGFADIDGDGDADLVVAHGNDMRPGHLVVFENIDGVLETVPSWINQHAAYYGHLALGDLNNDGTIDVAVSRFLGPDRFDSPGGVEVYLNRGGVLDATPSWEADGFFTFSLALGDMNKDGVLDLGVAVGEAYYNDPGRSRVFVGDGHGGFGDAPVWLAPQAHHSFDVVWADFDGDGWLDLALAQQGSGHRIYPNVGGVLSDFPMWEADEADGPFEGNTLDVGDVDGDGLLDLVVSDNDQLGGVGMVRLWCGSGLEVCHSISQEYASAVDLVDFDADGDLDLSYGGWWAPVSIIENEGGVFGDEPIWVSAKTDIVLEAIDWADVDGRVGAELMVTDWAEMSGNRLWSRD